jgi:hypothetical protein
MAQELRGLIEPVIILVFKDVNKCILIPNDGFPASSKLNMQVGVIPDADIVSLPVQINIWQDRNIQRSGNQRRLLVFFSLIRLDSVYLRSPYVNFCVQH